MSKAFSLYLDLLRLAAALTVLFAHAVWHAAPGQKWWPDSLGHNAVIVFFLLSGYVIAYVADTKERDARSYWVSRLARIYSVALPALLLTVLADRLGAWLHPAAYAGDLTTHDHAWLRLLVSLSFTNELWFVSVMPFSNSPYWSLCYEMAYYLLFALWAFGGPRRWLWLLLAAAVIGPKILLLAPIWALGAWLYHWRAPSLSPASTWMLWLGSSAGIAAFVALDLGSPLTRWSGEWLGAELQRQLHFSKHFVGDYLLALLMAAHFLSARQVAEAFAPVLQRGARAIRWAAGYTFSIYLFHLPLVLLAAVLTRDMAAGPARFALVVLGTLAVVLVVGHFTEQRKEPLRRCLDRCLPRFRATAMTGSGHA
jgi:peptidoglycan/LPS O-acetylase OafA/YrhL